MKLDETVKRIVTLEEENRKTQVKLGTTRAELKTHADSAADQTCGAAYYRSDAHRRSLEKKIDEVSQQVNGQYELGDHIILDESNIFK